MILWLKHTNIQYILQPQPKQKGTYTMSDEQPEKLLNEKEIALLLGAERANINDLSPQARTALALAEMFMGIKIKDSTEPSGRSDCCPNNMEMIGDLVFECSVCKHTEIGCSHDRKNDDKTICKICRLTLSP